VPTAAYERVTVPAPPEETVEVLLPGVAERLSER
jgi:hypothetical protein